MKFLSFIISTLGIQIDLDKITIIIDQKELIILKGLRSFFSFYNFYRTFLQNFKYIIQPLTKLLKEGAQHVFSSKKRAAFDCIKELILLDTILIYYSLYKAMHIEIDTSNRVIIGVLFQLQNDNTQKLVVFYLRII